MRKFLSVLIVVLFASNAWAAELTEPQKINALLNAFTTSDIIFIRNGEEHSGKYAYDHFEAKLKEVQGVVTAEDFITKVASTSRETGSPYMIKLSDGTTMDSSVWLHEKLKEIEK